MPNIQSAKKRVLVTQTRTARNKARKSALRTAIKKAKTAEPAAKAELVRSAIQQIDRAAAKGLLHKNTAAHRKSALAKQLQA